MRYNSYFSEHEKSPTIRVFVITKKKNYSQMDCRNKSMDNSGTMYGSKHDLIRVIIYNRLK